MKELIRLLFPINIKKNYYSLIILMLRLLFGILFMIHGIQKWSNFSELSGSFPDPIGMGSSLSLGLTIFGEVACSLGFIFGFLYRLILIPMIFIMAVAFFIIHGGDDFAVRELSFVYMITFIILYIAGPGKYSIDYWLGKNLYRWIK